VFADPDNLHRVGAAGLAHRLADRQHDEVSRLDFALGHEQGFGGQEHGGYDCSGLVWRVYKTKPFPGAPLLGDILKGRTTYAMSAEVKKPERIGIEGLEPGDVVFFGAHGPKSTPLEVGHTGIYVGNGWFVHSSSAGVTLQPLQGWYTTTFAWARRPLLEAGLTAQ